MQSACCFSAYSVVVMLRVWYALAFWFDSHLGDFPFLFLNFFITFQTFPLGVRFRLQLAICIMVTSQKGLALGLGVSVVLRG